MFTTYSGRSLLISIRFVCTCPFCLLLIREIASNFDEIGLYVPTLFTTYSGSSLLISIRFAHCLGVYYLLRKIAAKFDQFGLCVPSLFTTFSGRSRLISIRFVPMRPLCLLLIREVPF